MKKIASVFLLAALLMTLAACGGKSDDAPASSTSTTSSTEAAVTDNTPLISKDYASLDFTKYLEIPDLSALKVSRTAIDEEWARLTNTILYQNIAFTDAAEGDSAELTDCVNIHYKGYAASADTKLSDETLDGMTNFDYDDDGKLLAGYDLVLGSNSFITAYESESNPEKNNKSFEEQLVGAKVGETRTITVTFPDNYGTEELNGTVAKFDVTINSLKKGTLPTELTDKMVSDYTSEEYPTVDALKAYVTKYQEESAAYSAVYDAFTVKDYPAELVKLSVSEYVSDYINANYDKVLSESESKAIYNEQYDNALASAHSTIGEQMILEYLFGEFDITLTQSEYIEKRAADFEENSFYYIYYYGISDVNALETTFGKDLMVLQYKYEMLLPKLVEAVTFE